jgi:Na+/H+-dicarboxylate symporter
MERMRKLPLHIKILIGLFLGIIWAVISAVFGFSKFTADWIAPFGEVFIRVLTMIAVPLVLFSIIQGITSLSDTRRLGILGLKTLSVYLVTTLSAIIIGLVLVNTFKPGVHIDENQRIVNRMAYELWVERTPGVDKLDDADYLNNTQYIDYQVDANRRLQEVDEESGLKSKISETNKRKESSPLIFIVDMVPSNVFASLSEGKMLQVIFFAIFTGVIIVMLPREKVEMVIQFVDGANAIFIRMVEVVMLGAPFFVFALMAGKVSELAGDDLGAVQEIFKALGFYSLVVVIGLALMIFIFYPTVVRLINKNMKYRHFFRSISPAQFLAFSTSSSAATLPVTMECVTDNLKVKPEIASFVLPIGATVNMDGTSLYQSVAVVFLAQFHLIDLSLSQQMIIVITATLASIGSAAVPSAGLIMLIIVLQSVGLNPAWIAIIFPVDRILDMCRTVVNVTGDASVSTIVEKLE